MTPWFAPFASALAAGAGFVVLRQAARGMLRPRGRRSPLTPAALGLDADPVELPGTAGTLRGWLLRAGPAPRATFVLAHGWNSNAADMLPWAAALVGAGFHVVVYDALGHGESDPTEFTSIRHLREDLATVLAWTAAQPIAAPGTLVFGHSMGGAAAVLLAASGPFPALGLVTAGSPTDPMEITREFLDSKRLPGGAIVRVMRPFWEPIVAEPYRRLRPVREIARATVPMLLLHGRRDRQVRVHHAERLAAAGPTARLVVFDEGNHWNLHAQPGFAETIREFVDQVMGKDGKED